MFVVDTSPLEMQLWYFDKLNVHRVCNFALREPTWAFSYLRFDGGPQLSLGAARTLDGTHLHYQSLPTIRQLLLSR